MEDLRRIMPRLLCKNLKAVHLVYELDTFKELSRQARKRKPSTTIEFIAKIQQARPLTLRELLHEEDLEEEQPQTPFEKF